MSDNAWCLPYRLRNAIPENDVSDGETSQNDMSGDDTSDSEEYGFVYESDSEDSEDSMAGSDPETADYEGRRPRRGRGHPLLHSSRDAMLELFGKIRGLRTHDLPEEDRAALRDPVLVDIFIRNHGEDNFRIGIVVFIMACCEAFTRFLDDENVTIKQVENQITEVMMDTEIEPWDNMFDFLNALIRMRARHSTFLDTNPPGYTASRIDIAIALVAKVAAQRSDCPVDLDENTIRYLESLDLIIAARESWAEAFVECMEQGMPTRF